MGLWVDGGVKALVQAVTWTCPDGMVSFPMTGTAYSRYLSSVQCSLQCLHPGAQSWCMYKFVRLGATWIGGGRSSALFTMYCVWLKLTVTFSDKCRHSSYTGPLPQTLRTMQEL